jgi:hypothetical protein
VRHPLWYRVLIALWGLWFTTALSEPAGAHTCPMHGGHGAHSAQTSASEAHGAHEGHHHPAKSSSKACTCLGQCSTTPPIAVPVAPTELAAARVIDVGVGDFAELSVSVGRRAHALPFANGPPSTIAL